MRIVQQQHEYEHEHDGHEPRGRVSSTENYGELHHHVSERVVMVPHQHHQHQYQHHHGDQRHLK